MSNTMKILMLTVAVALFRRAAARLADPNGVRAKSR